MAKSQAECDVNDPKQMFSWMFTAGIPDPRGEGKFPNQPLIPPACFEALSQMIYDMGGRFHPELQTRWVSPRSGPERNFAAWGTTDIKPEDIVPDVAAMAADQFPALAEQIAKVTPDSHSAALAEQTDKLLDSLARLRAARENLDNANSVEGGG